MTRESSCLGEGRVSGFKPKESGHTGVDVEEGGDPYSIVRLIEARAEVDVATSKKFESLYSRKHSIARAAAILEWYLWLW